jgi:hypothetical protein
MTKFKALLQMYQKHLEINDTMAIEDDILCIEQSLDCSTPFTAFKRWYIIDNKDLYNNIYCYLCDKIYI